MSVLLFFVLASMPASSVVFPVIGLVLLYRVTRPDMGYYRWSLKTPKGIGIVAADLFAVGLSLYIGWVRIWDLLP